MAVDGVTPVFLLLPYSLTATLTSTTPKVIDRKSNKEKMLAMRLYRIRKKHYQSRKRLLLLMSLWCSILSTVSRPRRIWCVESRHGVIVIGNSNSNSKDYLFLSNSNSNSNRHFKFYCNSNSNS